MNFENKTSLSYKVAEALFLNGPMPANEVFEYIPDVEQKTVTSHVSRMCFEADLEKINGKMHLRAHVRRYFADKHADKNQVAGPRFVSSVRDLDPKYFPSPLGIRTGSNDYRAWGSRFA